MEKSYSISFEGYWRDQNNNGIPSKSGVYCVYVCSHNSNSGKVNISKLIYIGESENVNDRIAKHEKRIKWKSHVNRGYELCFSFAPSNSNERDRVEAALIFKHKPPVNIEYANNFPFDTTTISTNGDNSLLERRFTVYLT